MTQLWNPYAPEHVANPYAMYARIRSEQPVLRAQTGEWIVTRYEDVVNVLGSESFKVGNRLDWMQNQLRYLHNSRVDFQAIVDAMQSFLVLLNPPQHTKVRSLVSSAWSDHNVSGLIKTNIHSLLQKVDREFDIINDFAMPLPVMTICGIMGIDQHEYRKLKELSERMIQSFNLYTSLKELVSISTAAKEFIRFFERYIQYRKQHPEQDLVSRIILANRSDTDPLSDEELISTCIFLFVAGEETTVNLIGNGMLALLNNRTAWEKLTLNPDLTPGAVNEILRYDSPVQLIGRIATTDCEIGGNNIPKGSTLTLLLGSANRDPDVFSDPDEFSIYRAPKQHLAFGRGKHFCLGSWLAKTQGELAIRALIDRFPTIYKTEQELKWNNHLAIRGLRSLHVNVG